MSLPSIFEPETTTNCLQRLDKLKFDSKPQWGTMNAAQMLAHLNVSYDITAGKIKVYNSFFTKLMLRLFVKKMVVGEAPYPKNSRTAPQFIIADQRDFEHEKSRLINHIKITQGKGIVFFEKKENVSFGVLSAEEWSNLYYKHLDHHFNQFGI